jgi:TRAP transporter 4TM/12TM fusion protein
MQHENTSDIEKKLKDLEKKEQAVARKLDTGFWYVFTASLSVFMVLFYLYNTAITPASAQYHRGIYVLITFVLVFLFYPGSKWSNEHRPTVFDILLALLAAFVTGYWMVEFEALNYRMGAETTTDFVVSTLGVLISLEVARRVLGWTLPLVGIVFLLYCYLGPYLPEVIAHRGFSIERTLNHVYLKQEGVFGIMANVLVTYVILFIFFGSFLKKSGAGQFFLDLPMALFGRRIGGPAKVSVIASGFFGSVSGSAIANTATTGTFTIPLMKRAGFKPHIAGGIEPAASVGGMFMPPIMGAGGFLMAEMTNTPYVEIMKMAVFPAILYFISVLVMVHFEAKRHGLRGVEDESAPKAKDILKKEWFMVVPLLLIIVLMLWGYSPGYSAVIATASCVLVSWFTKDKRMGPKEIWEALLNGAQATLVIGATVGVIGIIVGSIALTGIGLRFSDIIFSLSGGILPLAIILVALASLILGMGVPVTASYLIVAVLVVPVMSTMLAMHHYGASGLGELSGQAATWTLLASHMMVYWFSQNSNNTPPVCLAAYTGAAIAGSDPWKTGWTAFNFAKALYIVPFLFAYSPALLLNGEPSAIIITYLTTFLGIISFSTISMGYFLCPTNILEWLLGVLGTVLLLFPRLLPGVTGLEIPVRLVDVLAIGLFVLVYVLQKIRIAKDPNLTLPLEERRNLRQEVSTITG